jgi:DNA-binding NarL/FixJ family response regulator
MTITSVQKRIVLRMAKGLTEEQIACQLNMPFFTIKAYIKKIYDELGMWNKLEVALWYVSHFKVLTKFPVMVCQHCGTKRKALSPRCKEALTYLIQGMSNKEISLNMGCAERTAKMHLVHAMHHYNVNNRIALAVVFYQQQQGETKELARTGAAA